MNNELERGLVEVCPNCGNTDFGVARDMIGTRHCECGHKWRPDGKKVFVNTHDSTKSTINITLFNVHLSNHFECLCALIQSQFDLQKITNTHTLSIDKENETIWVKKK